MLEEIVTGGSMMGGLQLMSMVNTLKTGNMIFDMILAMLLPIVLRYVFSFEISSFSKWMQKLICRQVSKHERFISHRSQQNYWGTISLDNDAQNTILLKAIQLYLHHHGNLKSLKCANLDLTSIEDKQSSFGYYYDYAYDDDDDDDDNTSKTLVGMLSKYTIVKKPLNNEWHDIGVYDGYTVQLFVSEDQNDISEKGNETRSTVTTFFHFQSSGPNAIDTFIETAYTWYMKELRSIENPSRFYYELILEPKVKDEEDMGVIYNRYRLSEEKAFGSLFFRQKESIINMIDHFQTKTGRYAIAGYPHKLGFLLHGPPGTGKTSLIKAIAQYTGRSIVNVPLSRISTNAELMDIFFRNQYNIAGCSVPIKLGFKDVIFVLEDVDAASDVVRRRDGKVSGPQAEAVDIKVKSPWQMMLESTSEVCKELVQELIKKSERLKKATLQSKVLCLFAEQMGAVPGLSLIGSTDEGLSKLGQDAVQNITQLNSSMESINQFLSKQCRCIKTLLDSGAEIDDSFIDELLGIYPDSDASHSILLNRPNSLPTDIPRDDVGLFLESAMDQPASAISTGVDQVPQAQRPLFSRSIKDKLNLTGLLNVLDGVVDTPGRILIMTSNHPELLDPALIRPGRIDKKIMLGHMHPADIISMVSHYFQTELNTQQTNQIQNLRTTFTPAVVEQLTAEHESVDEMIAALVGLSSSRSTALTSASSSFSYG